MPTNTHKNGSPKTSSPLSPKDLDDVSSLLRKVNRETKILAATHRAMRGLIEAGAAPENICKLFGIVKQAASALEALSQELAAFIAALTPQLNGELVDQQAHPKGNGQAPLSSGEVDEHRAKDLLQLHAKDGFLKS